MDTEESEEEKVVIDLVSEFKKSEPKIDQNPKNDAPPVISIDLTENEGELDLSLAIKKKKTTKKKKKK